MKLTGSVESALESAAAASFGACVGYSAWLAAPAVEANQYLFMLGGGALGFFAVAAGVQQFGAKSYSIPAFPVVPIESADPGEMLLTEPVAAAVQDGRPDELVLTLEHRLAATRHTANEVEVLLLDDMLTQPGPDSRVVQLFDPAAIPTPGALRSRIDRHLQDQQTSGYPDAAQALHEALADLRRSLR